MSNPQQPKVFVSGASGQLGRGVVEHLLASGASHIVAGTRQPDALADFSARGVEVKHADFDDPASLNTAFAGIDRILIISALDTPDDPPRRLRQHLAAVDAAARAGVSHIVYTSMLNPGPGSPIPFAPDHYGTEQAIKKSGIPFTILQPNWYADNVFMWLPQVLASGQWITAAGEGRTAYLWRDDLAKTAAAALFSENAESSILPVTGPQALTSADVIAAVNAVFDTSIALVPVNDAALRDGLTAAGVPPQLVELLVVLDVNTRQGGVDVVSDNVEHLTGKPPRDLHDFLVEHRGALLAARDSIQA